MSTPIFTDDELDRIIAESTLIEADEIQIKNAALEKFKRSLRRFQQEAAYELKWLKRMSYKDWISLFVPALGELFSSMGNKGSGKSSGGMFGGGRSGGGGAGGSW